MAVPMHYASLIGHKILPSVLITICGLGVFEVLLSLSSVNPSPWESPCFKEIDPYGPNPYVRIAYPYLFFHLPGARYAQIWPEFRVEYWINNRGFRGPNYPSCPPLGQKRLLVIGDSMVEGAGVNIEQTFCSMFNQRLADRGWEVLNVGMMVGSPIYFAANMPRYLALAPDAALIVLNYNDLLGNCTREVAYECLPHLPGVEKLCGGIKKDAFFGFRTVWLMRNTLNRRHEWRPCDEVDGLHLGHRGHLAEFRRIMMCHPSSCALSEREWEVVGPVT
ncbi:hypothetical protein HQ520_15970, partial [bacterium]|nr:hypothetical protein [bacterium]